MVIGTAIDTFEDNAKRILWLPSITLGYIYTHSGDLFHFALAVIAIGGARLFRFLIESEFTSKRGTLSSVGWLREKFSNLQSWPLAGVALFYFITMVYAPIQLYQYFTHQDIVLVGLAGIWCGVLIVILVNLTIRSSLSTDD